MVTLPPVGLAWYTAADWAVVQATATDPDQLESSYEAWLVTATHSLQRQQGNPNAVVPVPVNAGELLAWCRACDVWNDATARADFVAERLHRHPMKPQD